MGQSPGCCSGNVGCELQKCELQRSSGWAACGPCSTVRGDDLSLPASDKRPTRLWLDSSADLYGGPRSDGVNCTNGNHSPRSHGLSFRRHLLFARPARMRLQDIFRLGQQIGRGTYGNVFLATFGGLGGCGEAQDPGGSPRMVAIKTFSLDMQEEADQVRALRMRGWRQSSFETESATLAQIEHPHIVRMHECYREESALYVVLELCRGGEVYDMVVQANKSGGIGDAMACRIFWQMLAAVSYLHAGQIVHRDLKTENFLLRSKFAPADQGSCIVKLCDFGTAVRLSDSQPRVMDRIGTLSYTAPEIYGDRGAALPADIWSLGVVLYVLVVGANPFRQSGADHQPKTIKAIVSGSYDAQRRGWRDASAPARDLIEQLLVVEETKRLPVRGALAHPWLAMADKTVDLARFAAQAFSLLMRFSRLDALQQFLLTIYARLALENDELFRSSYRSDENSDSCPVACSIPWYDLFVYLDVDCDGRIGLEELVTGFERLLGVAVSQPVSNTFSDRRRLRELGCALDVDDSGAIEWAEWIALAQMHQLELIDPWQQPVQQLVEQPAHCDAERAFGSIFDDIFDAVFRAMDVRGDGFVSAEDLTTLLCSDLPGTFSSEVTANLLRRWVPRPRVAEPCEDWASEFHQNCIMPKLEVADLRRALEVIPTQHPPEDSSTRGFFSEALLDHRDDEVATPTSDDEIAPTRFYLMASGDGISP